MLTGKKKINYFDMMIDLVFVAFFVVHYLLPSFDFNHIIPMVLALAYCIYLGIKDLKLGANIVLLLGVVVFLSLIYTALTETQTISSEVENIGIKQFLSKFNEMLMMFFPLLLSYRVTSTYTKKTKLLVLAFCGVIFLYVLINTFMLLILEPGAIRHWDDFSSLANDDIGSYDFVYAVPIAIGVLAICNKKFNGLGKTINAIAIVFLFIFLVNAGYTLALIIAMIGLVLVGYAKLEKGSSKLFYIGMCVLGAFFIPAILKLLYTYLPKGDITLRIKEIYVFLTSGDSSGYNLNGRLSLYGKSLLAFLDSPLIGNRRLDFNGHGTFLTTLADTGIMGFLPMCGLVIASRRYVKKILGTHNQCFMPVFVGYILMGIVNPIHATNALSFSMWCIAPLMVDYFYNVEEKADETTVEN